MATRSDIGRTAVDAGPPAEDVSDEGVDLTLVRWMLSLTPRERLEWCQRQAAAVQRLRAFRSGLR